MAAATCAFSGAQRDLRYASRRLGALQSDVFPTRLRWDGHTATEWSPALPHAPPVLMSRASGANPSTQAPPAHPAPQCVF